MGLFSIFNTKNNQESISKIKEHLHFDCEYYINLIDKNSYVDIKTINKSATIVHNIRTSIKDDTKRINKELTQLEVTLSNFDQDFYSLMIQKERYDFRGSIFKGFLTGIVRTVKTISEGPKALAGGKEEREFWKNSESMKEKLKNVNAIVIQIRSDILAKI